MIQKILGLNIIARKAVPNTVQNVIPTVQQNSRTEITIRNHAIQTVAKQFIVRTFAVKK